MSLNARDIPTALVVPSLHVPDDRAVPAIYGLPLKYVSLVTLAVQNAALTLIMHTSRIATPPSRQYSAASAVLLNELLKGTISLAIAFSRVDVSASYPPRRAAPPSVPRPNSTLLQTTNSLFAQYSIRTRRLVREIFSPDCWKLSVPAILYVVQNNLQYVAASNLDAATFQVTYQMKILTTAAFSVLLLRRQLTRVKWLALFLLAIGVGIVQIQSNAGPAAPKPGADVHTMDPLRGFLAVTAACFTSGLAGVYFEMVLKNSQADLWVRNVQLSLFSLPPALLPALLAAADHSTPTSTHSGLLHALLRNFGPWAWATVFTQVLGGLLTALVIKHADNILKGFATALSIILAAVASVLLFDFSVSPAFVGGASVVLGATWMYNWPGPESSADADAAGSEKRTRIALGRASKPPSALGSPVAPSAPLLGHPPEPEKKRVTARAIAAALGLPYARDGEEPENEPIEHPLYTPPPTRPPSPMPSHPPPSRPSSRLAVPSPYLQSRSASSSSLQSDTQR